MVSTLLPEWLRYPLLLALVLLASAFFQGPGVAGLSRESAQKLQQALAEVYPGQRPKLEKLTLDKPDIEDTDVLNADGKWFAIREKGLTLGWLMAGRIWGKEHEFEYAMIVDTSLKILRVSVLSYPDSNGMAVTGQDWLSGFGRFSSDSLPCYGKNVDALSGATVSGKSLTASVSESLQMLKKLKDYRLLR